jgi:hypothetical protein
MVNPKYLILNIDWIKYLEKDHHWFNSKFRFRKILEILLSRNDSNINMFIMFNEKEIIWTSIEDHLDIKDLDKIDIDYLGEIIDDVICRFYLDLSSSLDEDEHRDSYLFYKWVDEYSLMLERDDDC